MYLKLSVQTSTSTRKHVKGGVGWHGGEKDGNRGFKFFIAILQLICSMHSMEMEICPLVLVTRYITYDFVKESGKNNRNTH